MLNSVVACYINICFCSIVWLDFKVHVSCKYWQVLSLKSCVSGQRAYLEAPGGVTECGADMVLDCSDGCLPGCNPWDDG